MLLTYDLTLGRGRGWRGRGRRNPFECPIGVRRVDGSEAHDVRE